MIILENDEFQQLSISKIYDYYDEMGNPTFQASWWRDGNYETVPGIIVYFEDTDKDLNFVFTFFHSNDFKIHEINTIKRNTRQYMVRTSVAVELVKGLKRGELMACGIIGYWLSDTTKGESQLFEDYYNICLQKYRTAHSEGLADPDVDREFACSHHIKAEEEKIRISCISYRLEENEWDRIFQMTKRYLEYAKAKSMLYQQDCDNTDKVSEAQMREAVALCADELHKSRLYNNSRVWAVVYAIWKRHGLDLDVKKCFDLFQKWRFPQGMPEVKYDSCQKLLATGKLYSSPEEWEQDKKICHFAVFGKRLEEALFKQKEAIT